MSTSIRIECTSACGAVPALFFAAAELGLDVALHVRSDGVFVAQTGGPGPAMVFAGERIVGVRACLDRLIGELAPALSPAAGPALERTFGELGPRLRDWLRDGGPASPDPASRAAVERALDLFEAELAGREWLLGGPTIVDAAAMVLPRLPALGIDLEGRWPGLAGLAARVVTRPAYARAQELQARAARATVATPAEILAWWFGPPATSSAELHAKIERWFLGGALLDDEVRERFGPTIDRALAGDLDAWAEDPRGHLALVLVLDQLTRHAFRGDPRAFGGDEKAQASCLQGVAQGLADDLSPEENAFFLLPLSHAEDLQLQERAVEARERMLDDVPASMRDFAAIGVEQAKKHRDIIRRFGRFPHRNEVLGRTSTAEERSFLATWMQDAPPKRFRDRFATGGPVTRAPADANG